MSQDESGNKSEEKISIPIKAEDVMVTEVVVLDGDASAKTLVL